MPINRLQMTKVCRSLSSCVLNMKFILALLIMILVYLSGLSEQNRTSHWIV